jgi:hypothetical protein
MKHPYTIRSLSFADISKASTFGHLDDGYGYPQRMTEALKTNGIGAIIESEGNMVGYVVVCMPKPWIELIPEELRPVS